MRVATPCVRAMRAGESGSFGESEIRPEEEGFEYVPLSHYASGREYLRVRGRLKKELAEAMEGASVVQMDYGGHPVGLGLVAWPIAGRLGRRRIWVFDGADPFPRLLLAAEQEKSVLKRTVKRWMFRRTERFCREAIRSADLVFAHNEAVVERFGGAWGRQCHLFHRTFVTADGVISEPQLAERNARLRDASLPLRLVVSGRQIRIKGTDQVLRAMAEARRAGTQVELDVVGDGEDLGEFRELTRSLGLGDAVRFLGSVAYGPVLFEVWGRAQAMVITNLTAEISRNVMLGMARGLPLIMYRNPATDRLIESHDAGVLVQAGDVASLTQTLIAVSRDRERLVKVAINGARLANGMTLEACHRRRAELAAECAGRSPTASVDGVTRVSVV